MHRSLITSTVIGTSAVIGALAFSAGGAAARTDSLGVSQQQALKEGGDLLILIRGGGCAAGVTRAALVALLTVSAAETWVASPAP